MIRLFLVAWLFGQTSVAQLVTPTDRTASGRCRGVHMPSPDGGANFLWTTFSGPQDKLAIIAERMKALGAIVSTGTGTGEMRSSYRDDLDVRAISRLLNEVDGGKFGAISTKDFMMPLTTLPADKCIRFKPKP